ncbi:MAG TPA: glycosyltransferase [Burkholderiales bacterium]|nr:glycosyltransferase [Burkholderiales bacterium]
MTKVLFVTTGLGTGGAEKMLMKLISRLHGKSIDASVVSLSPRGPVSSEIEALGVETRHLGVAIPLGLPWATVELAKIARRERPDVIQGWMYHGNLAAALARSFAGDHCRLCFGVRQSLQDLEREKPLTRQVIRVGRWLSHRADAIVYNSQVARRQHECFGYAVSSGTVIDNGFDTNLFRPDEAAYRSVRSDLGLNVDAPLIGLIARWHPMKSHDLFLKAASILATHRADVHFLLVGFGVTPDNPVFSRWLDVKPLAGRVHLLGERQDVARLTAALDVASCSSSWGEAFPNILGEAMSCGVPCVASDVGDVRRIIGDTGIVFPVGDSAAMTAAWRRMLDLSVQSRRDLGGAARRRIVENFSLDRVAYDFGVLYAKERQ